MTEQAQKIQALLFTAGEAVTREDICKLINIEESHLQEFLQEITSHIDGSGLALVVTDTKIELTTAPAVTPFLTQFDQEASTKLSAAAAETLSIIAYRGPISRFDIDMIRGVDCRRMIRILLARGIVERHQRAGRTPLYDITEDFLKHIGVTKKEDLPNYENLHNTEAITRLLSKE